MPSGGDLRIDAVGGPNWEAALEMLKEGRYIVYQGVGLALADFSEPGHVKLNPRSPVTARVFSEWEPANLTQARALADLSRGQTIIEGLVSDSSAVRQLVSERGLRYELLWDYGMGAVLIATEASGAVEWHFMPWARR
jgi:hypothetical protein